MRTEHDLTANALYIALRDAPVASTVELQPGTLVDSDADGSIVGVEIINPAREDWLDTFLDRYGDRVNDSDRNMLIALYGPPRHIGYEYAPKQSFQTGVLDGMPA